jgi:hypothetical protein
MLERYTELSLLQFKKKSDYFVDNYKDITVVFVSGKILTPVVVYEVEDVFRGLSP